MDKNEFHSIVNPEASRGPNDIFKALFESMAEAIISGAVQRKEIPDEEDHNCDECNKAGNCDIEVMMRAHRERKKREENDDEGV